MSVLQRYGNGDDNHWSFRNELDLSVLSRHEDAYQVSLHRVQHEGTNGVKMFFDSVYISPDKKITIILFIFIALIISF